MKQGVSYIIASVLIGLFIFAVFYWVFHFSSRESWILAVSGLMAGMVVGYLRPLLKKKKIE